METNEIKKQTRQLMESCETCYLGTVDEDGFPQVRAMANSRDKEKFGDFARYYDEGDWSVYFATGTSSEKMKHLKANPKATVYFYEGMQTLLLCGVAEIVTQQQLKQDLWRDEWRRHFPGGVEDAGYTVIAVRPNFAKGLIDMEEFRFEM